MRRPHNTAVAVLLLLTLSLVMYGCGGGGSSGPAPMPEPEPPTVHEIDLPVAPMVPEGVTYMVPEISIDEAVTIEAGDMETIGYVTFSCPAGGAACVIDMDDEGNVTSTGGEATVIVAESVTMDLQAAIDAKDTEDENARQAMVDAEAMKLAAAIGLDEDGDPITPTAGLPAIGGTAITPSNGKIKTGMNDGDFMASSMAVADIDDWDSDATMRTVKTVTDTVVLYSNIDDPTDEYYDTFFGTGAGRQLSGDDASAVEISGVATEDGELTFATGGFTASKENAGKFMIEGFAGQLNTSLEIPGTDDTDTPGDDRERTGSFYGIPGTFTCAGCLVRVSAQGALVVSGGDMTFTPDEYTTGTTAGSSTRVRGVIPDPDYMVFGYWLEATTKDGKETYKFSPYSMGTRAYGGTGNAVASADAVTGTATYEGPATGKYLKKTLTVEDGAVTGGAPFATGQFTATAMLEASFGGDDVAVSDKFTISGTISDFMDGDTSINENWSLMLKKSLIDTTTGAWALAASGTGATKTADTQGMASGNSMHDGAWAATFHGNATDSDDDAIQPGSVTGTFNGHFQDGHVAGAFGATKQD